MSQSPRSILKPPAASLDILAALNREDKITVLVSLHQVEYALSYCLAHRLRCATVVSPMTGRPNALRQAFSATSTAPRAERAVLAGADRPSACQWPRAWSVAGKPPGAGAAARRCRAP